MEIVILDSLTLGLDIDLSRFKKFGSLKVYEITTPSETVERIATADIIITNKVVIGKKEFTNAPNLKLICVAATGYNNIDTEIAKQKKVVVANVKNYSTESVAQHTFSLILALENSLFDYIKATRNKLWEKSPIFTMLDYPFSEIFGKKLGVIGYGTIGKRVASIAKTFGMKVLIGKRPGIKYTGSDRVEFEELLSKSDIISIHAPLSENTKNLISINEFKKMKKSAILINVARGGIVNEEDLYLALSTGIIRAAAIDVCEQEPIQTQSNLTQLENLIITPHIAWASYESRLRLLDGVEQNIEQFLAGNSKSIDIV